MTSTKLVILSLENKKIKKPVEILYRQDTVPLTIDKFQMQFFFH